MDLFINKERACLTDAMLLGEGGEARVYRWKNWAVKVFHDIAAPEVHEGKRKKLHQFPRGLPANVLGPLALANDKGGAMRGYAMERLEGATDFGSLSNRAWRDGVLSNRALLSLFTDVHHTLQALHRVRVVVGDLNDGNLLLAGGKPYFIDADSMQFASLPCTVGHERFLDPRLYGVNLLSAPRFDAGTDWYAYAVMLFSSLLYVHPFGGVHRKLPTLLRRAEARHSVMQSDVAYPRSATHFKALPDSLLHWFSAVFERDERSVFPEALLDLSFHRCACGLEHARPVCPDCQKLGPLAARQALRSSGRCTARTVFRTSGKVLAASHQGGLRYAYEENGVVRREDGSLVTDEALSAGTAIGISGRRTYLADSKGSVRVIDDGKVVERASTAVRGTVPVLAAASTASYRQEQEWLVEQNTGARVGQVMEGHTWLWTGERLGLGFYRAGNFTVVFLLKTGSAGLQLIRWRSPPQWQGRIVEADCVFDERHALLTVLVEKDGQRLGYLWLLGADGQVLANAEGTGRMFARARGKALLRGHAVCSTDEGLLSLKVESGRLIEGTLFTDCEPFVSAGDELVPQADGALFVIGARDITQLSLH